MSRCEKNLFWASKESGSNDKTLSILFQKVYAHMYVCALRSLHLSDVFGINLSIDTFYKI